MKKTLLLILLLAGCAQQPVPSRVDERILAGLDSGRERSAPQQPAAVNEALLPPLRAQMPATVARPVEPRFDLVVNNAPAQQVFLSIVSGTRYSSVVHPAVAGSISVNLKDVTVPEALEAIREVYGYEYRIDGTRIYVQPAGLQTRMFQVNYLVGIRSGSSSMSVSAGAAGAAPAQPGTAAGAAAPAAQPGQPGQPGQGAGSSVTTTTRSDFWTDLSASLRTLVGAADGRNVIVNPQSGVILVRAMPDELRAVENYLKAMRVSVERQVMLEAKLVEVTLSEGAQTGVNWAALARTRNIPGLGAATGGASISSSTFTQSAALEAAAGAAGSAILGLAFQTSDFALLLNFLESQGSIQVLSSPRVATLNNQKAVLKVGSDRGYVTGVTSTDPTVNGGVVIPGRTTATLTSFFEGVSLDITPQIDEDGNILLHIHPLVSRVEGGIASFSSSASLLSSFTTPRSVISESDTMVRVQDGNIVALGGLMQISLEADKSGIPGAQDAPGVGVLFGNRARTTVKKELVILVKPTVIQSDRNWEQNLIEARDRLQGYGAGSEPAR